MKASKEDIVEIDPTQYKIANLIGAQITTRGGAPRFSDASPMLYLEVRKLDFRRPSEEREMLRRLRSIDQSDQRAVLVEADSVSVAGGMLVWTVFGYETVYRVQLVLTPQLEASALIGEISGDKIYRVDPARLRAWYIEPNRRRAA